jgi:hypothetical protein
MFMPNAGFEREARVPESFCGFRERSPEISDHLLLKYYNELRPHQGLGNMPIPGLLTPSAEGGEIESISILGGFFYHYQRKAA